MLEIQIYQFNQLNLKNTPIQPIKFNTKNWAEINDDACGTYNTNSQIEFKTSILKPSSCDCSDAHIFVSGTIAVPNTGTAPASSKRKKSYN